MRLSVSGNAYDASKTRSVFEREAAAGRDQLSAPQGKTSKPAHRVLHPYTGFNILPALSLISLEAEYFRKPESESTFDILLLGGSVASAFGRYGTATLVEALQRDPRFENRRIKIMQHGRASFKQPQQINNLVYLLSLGFKPDAVINLDGFNEVAVAYTNDRFLIHPIQPSVTQWGPYVSGKLDDEALVTGMLDLRILRLRNDQLAESALDSRLLWSSIAGNFLLSRLQTGRRQQADMQTSLVEQMATHKKGLAKDMKNRPVIQGPDWERGVEPVLDLCVGAWKECSLSMDAICKQRSIFYLHVLQPTLHSAGAKVATESEIETGGASKEWMEAVRVGYPKLEAVGHLLREEGVAFFDASKVFADVSETLYYDSCHFDTAGHVILAASMAQAFLGEYPGESPEAPIMGRPLPDESSAPRLKAGTPR